MKKIFCVLFILALTCAPAFAEAVSPISPAAIDLTPLFQAVIAVLAALITGKLLPWIKVRTNEVQRERLAAIVHTLVYAAQQLYKNGEIQDRLDYVQEALLERGYTADRDAIEAAVRELKLADGLFIAQEAMVLPQSEGGNDDE
ncbi:MAG: phage holin, LLH family [Clostridia bacterium]